MNKSFNYLVSEEMYCDWISLAVKVFFLLYILLG